jgi:hypothetical protein
MVAFGRPGHQGVDAVPGELVWSSVLFSKN